MVCKCTSKKGGQHKFFLRSAVFFSHFDSTSPHEHTGGHDVEEGCILKKSHEPYNAQLSVDT